MTSVDILMMTKRLRQMMRAMDKHSKYIQERYDVTIPQLICLREIHRCGRISFGDITHRISLNKSTVSGIVDRLENRGLLRRRRIKEDRRKIHVEITEKGKHFVKVAPPPLPSQFIEKFKSLNVTEIDMLLGAIEKICELFSIQEKKEKDDYESY